MKFNLRPQELALVITTIILVSSFTANIFFCSQQGLFAKDRDLQEQIMDLRSQLAAINVQTGSLQDENAHLTMQIAVFEGQAATLTTELSSLHAENSKALNEKADLQNQLSLLSQGKVPAKLVTRLGASDMRYNYSGQDFRLYISGEVCNVGTESAVNSSLHLTLYQGTVVAVDTYIVLGDLPGGSFTDVGRNIYYTGEALTKWTIIPEFNQEKEDA